MRKLILSTPWYKKDEQTGKNIGRPGQSHSWETYMKTGIGLGYILTSNEYQILNGALGRGPVTVVLLRNDKEKKRAEAWLTKIIQTPRKAQGGWRYDIHFKGQKEITPYVYMPTEKLKRNGVKIV
jgi:hypothetical protein